MNCIKMPSVDIPKKAYATPTTPDDMQNAISMMLLPFTGHKIGHAVCRAIEATVNKYFDFCLSVGIIKNEVRAIFRSDQFHDTEDGARQSVRASYDEHNPTSVCWWEPWCLRHVVQNEDFDGNKMQVEAPYHIFSGDSGNVVHFYSETDKTLYESVYHLWASQYREPVSNIQVKGRFVF